LATPTHLTQHNDKRRTLHVLAVGDCNTWGITNPPIGNTILDKFCRLLEADGTSTSSQNLGFGMATSREGVQLVRHKAGPADVVLINFGLVDTWVTSIPQIYIPYYPDNFLRKRLRKLLKFVKRRLRSPWLRPFVPLGNVVPIDEYVENIHTMISLVRTQKPPARVLLWGSPPVQHDLSRNANLEHYNKRLERVARDTNSLFVSTENLVNNLSSDDAYVDAVHLNEAATEAIAAQLAVAYQTQQLAAAG